MGFFDFFTKASRTASVILKTTYQDPIWTPIDYKKISEAGYRNNATTYACVNEIAKTSAAVPFVLYEKGNRGELEEVFDNQLIDVMMSPNANQDYNAFMQDVVGYLMLSGNSYIELVKSSDGRVLEMYSLRPDYIKIRKGDINNVVGGYEFGVGGEKRIIDTEDMIHIKLFNPINNWYGQSPITAAAKSIDQNNLAKSWNVSLLQNGGQPSGAFVSEVDLTEEQFEALRQEYDNKYAGAENSGRPLILEGGIDWKQMSLTPHDMSWLESQKLSAKEIAMVFGVPPELIGDSSNKTYSNYAEARKAFYMETVLPLLNFIYGSLNRFVTPVFGENLKLAPEKDQIEALQEDVGIVWDRVQKSNFLTINEKRQAVGYEDIDGGDVIIVDKTLALQNGEFVQLQAPKQAVFEEEEKSVKKNSEIKENREELWLQNEKKRQPYNRKHEKTIEDQFEFERKKVVSLVKNQQQAQLDSFFNENDENWKKIIADIYFDVTVDFANDKYKEFSEKALGEIETKQELIDVWTDKVTTWLAINGALKVSQITETTQDQIRKELAEGVELGESIETLAERIDKLYLASIMPNRSTVIARTEVISASNLGNQIAARQARDDLGLSMKKIWISSLDSRTRPAHAQANGQKVGIDDPFVIDGERLMYAGDTSLGASGRNTIMCRCAEGYEVE